MTTCKVRITRDKLGQYIVRSSGRRWSAFGTMSEGRALEVAKARCRILKEREFSYKYL